MRHTGFLLLSFVAALLSCSSDDEPEQRTDGRKLRQLTIAEVPVTRATLTASTSKLGAAWEAGDQATYFNVTAFQDISPTMRFGDLTASSSAETSTFTGKVYCNTGDNVALFYPQQTVPTQGTNRGKFTISLNEQDGKLETIAKNFHYVYGVATVTSVTESTANATIDNMQSLLAVCKFTFKDEDNAVIPVKTLTINYYDNRYALGYPLTATLTPTADVGSLVYPVQGDDNWSDDGLSIVLESETSDGVYVALFPYSLTGYMHFTVTGSTGTYTGTAKATLKAGKYYPVSLKLTKKNN